MIHKCFYIYLQTNKRAFTNRSPFAKMQFFQKGILYSLLDVSYNFSQSHECKFEGMTEFDHIVLHLHSVQLLGLLHHNGFIRVRVITGSLNWSLGSLNWLAPVLH